MHEHIVLRPLRAFRHDVRVNRRMVRADGNGFVSDAHAVIVTKGNDRVTCTHRSHHWPKFSAYQHLAALDRTGGIAIDVAECERGSPGRLSRCESAVIAHALAG